MRTVLSKCPQRGHLISSVLNIAFASSFKQLEQRTSFM